MWVAVYIIAFAIIGAYLDLDFKQRLIYDDNPEGFTGYSPAMLTLKSEFEREFVWSGLPFYSFAVAIGILILKKTK